MIAITFFIGLFAITTVLFDLLSQMATPYIGIETPDPRARDTPTQAQDELTSLDLKSSDQTCSVPEYFWFHRETLFSGFRVGV